VLTWFSHHAHLRQLSLAPVPPVISRGSKPPLASDADSQSFLEKRGIICHLEEPLHSRVRKYMKATVQNYSLDEISKRVIKTSISVFDQFNDVRNNVSLAHDNQLIQKAEVHFIFDAVGILLRFLKRVEEANFAT
jgi:Abortive infection C-terminus